MKSIFKKVTFFMIIYFFGYSLFALQCSDYFSQTMTSKHASKNQLLIDIKNLDLHHIFSPKFTHELEQFGELKIQASEKKEKPYAFNTFGISSEYSYSLFSGEKFIMSFTLIFPKKNQSTVYLNGLRLENPMNFKKNLEVSQNNKGLPMAEFRLLKNKMISIIQKNNFKSIQTTGASSYLVAQLYRRFIGMKPTDPEAQKYFDLFDYYSRNLGIEKVNEALGDIYVVNNFLPVIEQKIIQLKSESPEKIGLSPEYINQQVVGYHYFDLYKKQTRLILLDPYAENQIINWSTLFNYGFNQLKLEL